MIPCVIDQHAFTVFIGLYSFLKKLEIGVTILNLMFLILVGRINQIMNGPVHKIVINPCLGDKIATQGNTQTLRGKPYLVMIST